jgi:hypothetical protein
MNSKHIFILLTVLTVIVLSGCVRTTQVRGVMVVPAETHSHTTTVITHYPPPHAPAHGHRHRYYDHDLQFDAGIGAYLVIGSPGVYFYDDHYLRFVNGSWQYSIRLNKPWRPAKQTFVPRKLWQRRANEIRQQRHEQRHENRHEERRQAENHRRDDRHRDAPRHGQRRNYHGHTLTYDAGIGAYRIVKQPGIYFYNDHYLRNYRGTWQVTKKLNGKWSVAKERYVPAKLWKKRVLKKRKYNERQTHEQRRSDDRRSERRRPESRRDERPRAEKKRSEKRKDERRDKRRDERRDERRRDDEPGYEDGKQLRSVNPKLFQGLQQ